LLFQYLNEGDACHEQLGNKYIHSKTLWTVELKPYGLPSFLQRVDDWKRRVLGKDAFIAGNGTNTCLWVKLTRR
jgi:hypothetical protein